MDDFDALFGDMIKEMVGLISALDMVFVPSNLRTTMNVYDEIIAHDDEIEIVMELRGVSDDELNIEIRPIRGVRVLLIYTNDGRVIKAYQLAKNMSEDIKYSFVNGVLNIHVPIIGG